MGLAPSLGKSSCQGDLSPSSAGEGSLPNATFRATLSDRRFGAGLFPVRSLLLRESPLVSLPPLIDMLKSSGYSRLI